MKYCASLKTLQTIKDMTPDLAKQIRNVWRNMTRDDIIAQFPVAAEYARQCINPPDTLALRRMVVDQLIGTYGIEYIGTSKKTGSHVYYCNAGDTYAHTVLFAGARLSVGNWGDLIEHNSIREV